VNYEYGVLTFVSTRINYEYKVITLAYNATILKTNMLLPESDKTFCIDKDGNKLKCIDMGETTGMKLNETGNYNDDKGSMGFKFNDSSSLSKLTLTYKFEKCNSVTIDIPIE